MIVQIAGKEHREGTSKKGKDYNFNVIYFTAKKAGVEGVASYERLLDPSVIPYQEILIGNYYELELDLSGAVVGLKHVEKLLK